MLGILHPLVQRLHPLLDINTRMLLDWGACDYRHPFIFCPATQKRDRLLESRSPCVSSELVGQWLTGVPFRWDLNKGATQFCEVRL
ncbi:hypothetical protein I8748_05905 [Nostoc sp. CENA67]|uniref:Uncharacterized protein n=1 Tax=Amazonocrinis nigriterrae CENA67 TaxID=2794033 RepID=A0A8J7HM11_9NOST|nr:hypothetical protein [Amazonocrinis nigriterrae]MBH8561717.1 hypothetical protein [Amazonocrinis nigriterrae CENA67]